VAVNATLYPAHRGSGKTAWVLDQTDKDVAEGRHVAIVVPAANHTRHADYAVVGLVDVYTEGSSMSKTPISLKSSP
jgi:hypothetical protein